MNSPRFRLVSSFAAAACLAACGSVNMDGQWTDPQRAPASLKGATVFVVCDADEQLVRQICLDRMAAEVNTAGGRAVIQPNEAQGPVSGAPGRYLPAARAANASALLHTVVIPAESYDRSGFSVGLGMGGRIGGGGFGGVGVSAPLGGPRFTQQYAANGSLSDVASGRLMWTAKARARAGDDLRMQVDVLGKALVEAAQKAGFF